MESGISDMVGGSRKRRRSTTFLGRQQRRAPQPPLSSPLNRGSAMGLPPPLSSTLSDGVSLLAYEPVGGAPNPKRIRTLAHPAPSVSPKRARSPAMDAAADVSSPLPKKLKNLHAARDPASWTPAGPLPTGPLGPTVLDTYTHTPGKRRRAASPAMDTTTMDTAAIETARSQGAFAKRHHGLRLPSSTASATDSAVDPNMIEYLNNECKTLSLRPSPTAMARSPTPPPIHLALEWKPSPPRPPVSHASLVGPGWPSPLSATGRVHWHVLGNTAAQPEPIISSPVTDSGWGSATSLLPSSSNTDRLSPRIVELPDDYTSGDDDDHDTAASSSKSSVPIISMELESPDHE